MTKRNYTHLQVLLPEILEMVDAGKTQREIADHFGLKDKYVVKQLLMRKRRKEEKKKAEVLPRPKGRPHKNHQDKKMNCRDCEWKTIISFMQIHVTASG